MKKHALITVIAVLSLFAAGIASADLLYTRQDASYSSTALGLIPDGWSPITSVLTNIGGNAGQKIALVTKPDGQKRLAITLTQNSNNVADTIMLFGTGPIAGPIKNTSVPFNNTRAMVVLGDLLYGASYGTSASAEGGDTIKAVVISDDSCRDTYMSWKYDRAAGDLPAHGEGLVANGGRLYAVFSLGRYDPATWSSTYENNRIVRLDAQLALETSADLKGNNVDGGTPGSIARDGSSLYVCSWGGDQPYGGGCNDESMIELVDLDAMTSKVLIDAKTMKDIDPSWSQNFTAVAVSGDAVFVQATEWLAEYKGYKISVYETTKSKLAAGDIGKMIKSWSGTSGYSRGMELDASTGALWVAAGDAMHEYKRGAWTDYPAEDLGGAVIGTFAAVPRGTFSDLGGGSSGGGCSTGALGLSLIAAMMISRRKKR